MDENQTFFKTLAELERHAQRAACPIYAIDDDMGNLVGSGFLLDIADETLLVTAAHVLYVRHEAPLYIPGPGKPVSFGGQAFYTGPSDSVSDPDYGWDVACVRLAPRNVADNTGCMRLTPADLDVSEIPQEKTLYGFAGFPGEANETLSEYKLPRNAYYYGGQPAGSDIYKQLGYNPETHFVMTFDQQKMVDHQGNIIAAPEPFGMSGGPVWRLGTLDEVSTEAAIPRVIGLGITWSDQLQVLSALRMSFVVAVLRDGLPDLAPYLPVPKYVGANVTINPTTA